MRVNVNLDTQMLAREERCKVVFACGCAAAEPSNSDSDVLTGAPHLYPSYSLTQSKLFFHLNRFPKKSKESFEAYDHAITFFVVFWPSLQLGRAFHIPQTTYVVSASSI